MTKAVPETATTPNNTPNIPTQTDANKWAVPILYMTAATGFYNSNRDICAINFPLLWKPVLPPNRLLPGVQGRNQSEGALLTNRYHHELPRTRV